jgi:5-methylcytosine-specific restriction endonuclease McrA
MRKGWAVAPKNDYPADWREIATAVKDAANWHCIRCGHEHRVEGWYILTVHHLDGDKANARWWNLRALCQRCHLSVQGRVMPERPYLFAHSAWFRPYVAGFYAYYHAGEDITREEAESNVDAYLALGQPWLYPYPIGGPDAR